MKIGKIEIDDEPFVVGGWFAMSMTIIMFIIWGIIRPLTMTPDEDIKNGVLISLRHGNYKCEEVKK